MLYCHVYLCQIEKEMNQHIPHKAQTLKLDLEDFEKDICSSQILSRKPLIKEHQYHRSALFSFFSIRSFLLFVMSAGLAEVDDLMAVQLCTNSNFSLPKRGLVLTT